MTLDIAVSFLLSFAAGAIGALLTVVLLALIVYLIPEMNKRAIPRTDD